jgi:hypothetical protein
VLRMLLLLGSSACSLPKGEAGVDASPLFAKPTIHPFLPSFLPFPKARLRPYLGYAHTHPRGQFRLLGLLP